MNAPNNHARPLKVACAFVCAHANALLFIHGHPPCAIVVCHADVVRTRFGLGGSDTDGPTTQHPPSFFSLASTRRPLLLRPVASGLGRWGGRTRRPAPSSSSWQQPKRGGGHDTTIDRPIQTSDEPPWLLVGGGSSTQAAAGIAAGRTPSDSLKWQQQLLADRPLRTRAAKDGLEAHTKAARGVGGGLEGQRRRRRRLVVVVVDGFGWWSEPPAASRGVAISRALSGRKRRPPTPFGPF